MDRERRAYSAKAEEASNDQATGVVDVVKYDDMLPGETRIKVNTKEDSLCPPLSTYMAMQRCFHKFPW